MFHLKPFTLTRLNIKRTYVNTRYGWPSPLFFLVKTWWCKLNMCLCNNPKLYKYNHVVCLYNRNGLPFNMYVLWVIFPKLNIYECLTTYDQKAIYFTAAILLVILAVDMMVQLIEAFQVNHIWWRWWITAYNIPVIVYLIISSMFWLLKGP